MPGKRLVKNGARGPQQVHMNKVKFDPYRYKLEDQRLPAAVVTTMTSLCCRRCCDILQWKVDYGKYILLERHRKCNSCQEKTVVLAYHRICQKCAAATVCCAKCQRHPALAGNGHDDECREKQERTDGNNDEEEEEEQVMDEEGEEIDGAERAGKDLVPSKYAFVDEEDSDEELKPLRGLDIRQLKQRKVAALKQQERERIGRMRERERRSVLRRSTRVPTREGDSDDSDEEI
ncbi:hypothetical protein DQ04_02221100 [Trypanosoma grayi]|uniref:hypothetical protein n=1 Tax=Trypanosoma grayi TaxID=71804 RepID=UPI0004F3F7CA|nr:hypothetical protein DQ04_02221100 [Trypanosoma grayi]KEG11848.1 hypothetical protein DQ04_02221100 [Trypanosoma grayi]